MNKLAPNIPNLIKQPSQCCVYCGKSYKKRINLDKHVVLCELLKRSKKTLTLQNEDEDEELPSQRRLFQMLLELGNKYNKLEEKVEELNKWVIKKKKKINVVEWLNTNIIPETNFDNLIERIVITNDDIQSLFESSFMDTLNQIFARSIYKTGDEEDGHENTPIFAFAQNNNAFYIYENKDIGWLLLSKEKLMNFMNKVYMKLFRVYTDYKRENSDKIRDDEKFSLLCDKTSVKLMGVDFRQDAVLSKIKSNMYSRMKTDMKALVEYEFEF